MITIVQAEDHQMVRAALKCLLLIQPDFEIIGEASDGLAAIKLVQKLQPRILLLDLSLPGLNGIEVLHRLRPQKETKSIVVSMHAEPQHVMEALYGGASGYVLKDSSSAELIEAIRMVLAGNRFVSPSLKGITFSTSSLKRSGTSAHKNVLTKRERCVLEMAADGGTNPMIAKKLGLSARTVESHRFSFMKKLGLKSQTELVRYAIRKKVISA
jgi:DNA-binding NarL/FixJ family response regulator